MQRNAKIKIDFNLLMSGTWVLEKKGKQTIHKFEKELGDGKIVIYNALDVPSVLDSKVLDFLIVQAQEKDWAKEIKIGSLRQIAKEVGLGVDKRKINRLKRSFKILANTRIEFHNCFIDTGVLEHFEGEYEEIDIGIISSFSFKRVKARGNPIEVKVIFNDNFLALCKYSLGYKLIPFAPINGLRDTAYALYKWAWRWYNTEKGYGERWIGDGKKLVEWYKNELNSTASYKYPSKVLERIKSAIKQLNEHSKVPFSLQIKEENGIYKIEIYRKEAKKREIPFDKLPKLLRDTLITAISKKKHIKDTYALARSMSWKEIEAILKKFVVVKVPRNAYEGLEFLRKTVQNEKEKEILSTVVAEKRENGIFIAFPKSQVKGKIGSYLDSFFPNWRFFLQEAVGYIKERAEESREEEIVF